MAAQDQQMNFEQAVNRLLAHCMGLRDGESCLVVCDPAGRAWFLILRLLKDSSRIRCGSGSVLIIVDLKEDFHGRSYRLW